MPGSGYVDLVSGNVQLKDAIISGLSTVTDLAGSTTDAAGQLFSQMLKIQYTVERINVETGQMSPPFTSDVAPTRLRNGDRVKVELVSTDDQYKLSSQISTTLVIKNLQDIIQNPEFPNFQFIGESGSGSVIVSNGAPSGFK